MYIYLKDLKAILECEGLRKSNTTNLSLVITFVKQGEGIVKCQSKSGEMLCTQSAQTQSLGLLLLVSIHHNLFITLLLGSTAKAVLAKQPCCIQTKVYRFNKKLTMYPNKNV